MKSGVVYIEGARRRCFYFTIRLEDASGKHSPESVKQTFYIVAPLLEASKEEAYLYLCHALLLSKCYANSQRLYKTYVSEFGSGLPWRDFARRHADLFEIWELRRCTRKYQILFADKTSARRAAVGECAEGSVSSSPRDHQNQLSTEEIWMSNAESNLESEKREVPTVELNCDVSSSQKKELKMIRQQLEETKNLLQKERADHFKKEEKYKSKISELQAQVADVGLHSSSRLQEMIEANEKAVETIESQYKKREAELHDMYQEGMQARDIRITELTDSHISLRQQQTEDIQRIAELERCLAEKNKLYGDRNFRYESSTPLRLLQLESEQRYLLLEREYREKLAHQGQLENELRSAKLQIISQQSELERASLLLSALKDGLQFVKQTIPQLS